MSSGTPLVSVIVPVYNGAKYLAQAIESVLAQNYAPLEVIVVDDGSSDDSVTVARGFGPAVRCVVQDHGGAAAARNRGVAESTGELLAFLDADDLWVPGKLGARVAALLADDKLDMVFGLVRQFRSPELATSATTEAEQPARLPGTFLIRRTSFLRVERFKSEWRVGEFIDWFLRATESGLTSKTLPELVLLRRLHDNNLGLREQRSRQDYVAILKQSLDRRRRGI